jgi:hypothetical protein
VTSLFNVQHSDMYVATDLTHDLQIFIFSALCTA